MNLDEIKTFKESDSLQETGIYCIKNTENGKCYVGQTKTSFYRRLKNHYLGLKRGEHSNYYLQNGWYRYGGESFEFEILERCEEERIDDRELYWIEKLESFENGYNIIDPVNGGRGTDDSKRISKERKKASNTFYKIAENGGISKGT